MSKRKKGSESLQFAVFFLVLVLGIIIVSLVFRVFFLFKESKFDGSSHFTLEARNGAYQYISFSPQEGKIGILKFKNTPVPFGIPVDAKIKSDMDINSEILRSTLFQMSFDFQNQKEINSIDFLRLLFFLFTVKDDSVREVEIVDQESTDAILANFFIDPQIAEEKLNIEIINSTEIFGLGNKLATLITNMGGNIVLVTTGDLKKESVIEYTDDSYTVEKIAKILKVKKEKKEKITRKSVADITLIVGEDHVR